MPRTDMIVLEPPSPYRNPITTNTPNAEVENTQQVTVNTEINEGTTLHTPKLEENNVEQI
ncbi:hypothetical protein Ocin01_12422 [Orchesella cincta]|uniref:Uncharacterized protein n=1 Tax=Orchesella cincta TaxID=48709 RepID=A0A1D2MMS4_ORCCI|nr:hypothetical protein Ocin01_12422 [Orchesella cincta]